MKHCKVQHPALYILTHPLISNTGFHITGQELRQFYQAVFRRCSTDPVEELIYIKIGRRRRDGMIFSFSNACSPGKIAAQLPESQITVGGKITDKLSRPGCIVFIILHKNTLTVKVPALKLKRPVFIFIETSHLPNPVRDRVLRQNGYPLGKVYSRITIYRGWSSRNRIENDGTAPLVIFF